MEKCADVSKESDFSCLLFKKNQINRNKTTKTLAFRFDKNWILLFNIGIFIVGAKRTAFGSFGGSLKDISATQLQFIAAKAALESAGVAPNLVDSVNIGHVLSVSVWNF